MPLSQAFAIVDPFVGHPIEEDDSFACSKKVIDLGTPFI